MASSPQPSPLGTSTTPSASWNLDGATTTSPTSSSVVVNPSASTMSFRPTTSAPGRFTTPCPDNTILLCVSTLGGSETFETVPTTFYGATGGATGLPGVATIPYQPSSSISSSAIAASSSTNALSISSTSQTTQSAEPASTTGGSAGASTQNASSSSNNTKTNTGAIAGAAVGGLLAGAFIVGVIAFLLLKKRSRKDRYISHNTYIPTTSPAYGGEKGMPMVSIAPTAGMDFLPQQADDAEVKHRLSTVVDQIDQHVENFYSHRKAPLNSAQEAEISRFETSELPLPLAACFQNSTAATTLIKHCLAYHIFNMTMTPSENSPTILPSEIAGVVKTMYHRSLAPTAPKDALIAFSTWKSLTQYLQPDLGRDQATARNMSESSARVANQFTSIFSPWAHAQYSDESRARHLTDLVNHAGQTAIWLFGQPDNYKFEWDVPNTRQNRNYTAVVVPAVWKTTHNGSRLTGKGQSVLGPIIREF